MTLQAGRESERFTFETEHIGFEVDFYHPEGKALALSEAVVRLYEAEKENAEIFTQVTSAPGSNTAFNSDEILSWFLLQSATSLAEHLPPKTMESAPASGTEVFVTFPIRFEDGTFTMSTAAGDVAMKALKLMVRVRILPKPETES